MGGFTLFAVRNYSSSTRDFRWLAFRGSAPLFGFSVGQRKSCSNQTIGLCHVAAMRKSNIIAINELFLTDCLVDDDVTAETEYSPGTERGARGTGVLRSVTWRVIYMFLHNKRRKSNAIIGPPNGEAQHTEKHRTHTLVGELDFPQFKSLCPRSPFMTCSNTDTDSLILGVQVKFPESCFLAAGITREATWNRDEIRPPPSPSAPPSANGLRTPTT